jgi:hypothetical protein
MNDLAPQVGVNHAAIAPREPGEEPQPLALQKFNRAELIVRY